MAYVNEYPYVDATKANSDWMLHKIQWLLCEWEKTNEVWENDHKAFLELKEYVMNYFSNLDLQEEVSKKLDEMLEDGTLATLLGVDNTIHYNITYMENAVGEGVIEGGLQGGTYLDNNRFIYAHVINDNEPATIIVLNVLTNTVIKTFNHNIGHGNGCAFNPNTNEFIFLDGASNALYVFDSINYNFKQKVTLSLGNDFIANGIGFLAASATDFDFDSYVLSTREKLFYINTSFEVINVYDLPDSSWKREPNLQTIFTVEDNIVLCSAYTNRWYVMSFPNIYHKTIYIDSFGAPLFAYEIEAIGARNLNEVYFASRAFSAGPQTVFLAKTSLLGKTPIDNNTFLSELRSGGYISLIVDESSTGLRLGSTTAPFASVAEAQSFAVANNVKPRIYLNSNISRSIYILTSCVLQGNNKTVKSLTVSCSEPVVIRNININGSTNYQYITSDEYAIGINCSFCVLYQVVISNHTEGAWDIFVNGYSTVYTYAQTASSANIFNKCSCNGIVYATGVIPRIIDTTSVLNGLNHYFYVNSFNVPPNPTPLPIAWRYGGQPHQFIFGFNDSSIGYPVSMNVGSQNSRYLVNNGEGIIVRFTLSGSGNLSWVSLGTTEVTSVMCFNIIQ